MGIIKKIKKNSWLIKVFSKSSLTVKRSLAKGYLNRKQYYPDIDSSANLKDLVYCFCCPNVCRFDCPVVEASKIETHSPAAKARIGYFLELGKLEKSEENIMPLLEGCVHCSGCQVWCPFDFAVGDLLDGVIQDLFKERKLPKEVLNFAERLDENNGLYAKEKYKSTIKELESFTKGTTYYFPGCVTMGNNTKVISSIKKIAKLAGEKIISQPEERWCCGAPSLYSGDIDKAKFLAQHNIDHFKELEIEEIICECPECVYMLKEGYKKIGLDHNIQITHISEWIYSLLENKKIKLTSNNKQKQIEENSPISYHDPCVLSRKLGVIDEPYEILKTLFSEHFVENPYSKELTHCCGFGGLVNIVNSELANTMSRNRLEEFERDGIKTIVTNCPTCWYSFMKNNEDLKFEIVDLVELVSNFIEE